MKSFDEAEAYLYDTPRFTKKNNPDHTREFMRRLGNPQESFKYVHVAGSNGKGSVCAMVHSALLQSGKKCGLFISPHLVTITERFQINGKNCEDDQFVRAFDKVYTTILKMVEEGLPHPTFFEMIFAIGMVIFEEEGVEVAVIETGVGGRLDTTNIIAKPLVCVITSISLEHTEYLGDTLEKIAREKAGIIKDGVPVVFDAKHKEVADVIFAQAKERKAPAYPIYPGDIMVLERKRNEIVISFDLNGHKQPIHVPFVADYQIENATLAMQACEILVELGYFTYEQAREGIATTKWPGRMQPIGENVYIDGAHNVDGITRFVDSVEKMGQGKKRLLFAMVKEKDYRECIHILCSRLNFTQIVVTQIEGTRMLPASEVAALFRTEGKEQIEVVESIEEAYRRITSNQEDEIVFCAGSLYLVGELLKIKEKNND